MKSTFSGLNTLVRGLYAQQVSLDTVGHNIANASTDGYSRQRANLSTTMPETVYGGVGAMQMGTGVAIESVIRTRDTFVDQQMWKESSSLGYGLASENTLGKIEGIFHDDSEVGIQTVLNNFWNSWQTLSTYGSNDSARTAVRERGAELVDAISHAGDQLKNLVTDVNSTLTTKVAQINEIASSIFNLNRQISNIEVGGRDNANDLRDKRDMLVDQLSKMASIRVTEDSDHNYIVQMSDVTLVSGGQLTKLGINATTDADYGFEVRNVVVAGTNPPQNVQFLGGEMKALQEANTTMTKGYLDKLATMSQFLLQEFNAVHRDGYGSTNTTDNNFFGDAGIDYAAAPLATNGAWLGALKVSPALYNADGLTKIAAKTAEVKSVVQSNAAAGAATVGGTYTPPAGDFSYKSFQVQVTSVAAGAATNIRYSLDNGSTWVAVAGPGPFALPYGLTFSIANSTGTAVNDSYNFSVPQGNASGDNAVLLGDAIKMSTGAGSVLSGSSLDDYYGSLVANLGIESQNRKRLAENQQTLVDQITGWRESTAGVNMDEEMSNMIRFQKGYNAAARVVTAIDEMLDKLINGTGIVGR